MDILRVFNNNVVLARDDHGNDVIATGRGLGFQAHPGDMIDRSKIVRIFVPADGRDSDHMAQLLSDIEPEHLAVISEALKAVGVGSHLAASPILVVALADHIQCALVRREKNLTIEYPLQAEVHSLYSCEYDHAVAIVDYVNRRLGLDLPTYEAVAITLHLVNAGFSSGDLSRTYQMTGVIQQLLSVIENTYSLHFDPTSVHVARFITHLRYLFVRLSNGTQLRNEAAALSVTIRQSYPNAYQCAQHIATILELRLGSPLTDDELAYLTLHVARLAFDT